MEYLHRTIRYNQYFTNNIEIAMKGPDGKPLRNEKGEVVHHIETNAKGKQIMYGPLKKDNNLDPLCDPNSEFYRDEGSCLVTQKMFIFIKILVFLGFF